MKRLLNHRSTASFSMTMILSFAIFCSFSVEAQIPDTIQTDTAFAQLDLVSINTPLWKFWLAFEDATGAKDTIWLIFDPRASHDYSTDSIFGEIASPIDSNIFWTRYCGSIPYNVTANGYFGYMTFICQTEICSGKYILPITLSWDSTLLIAAYSPGGLQFATLYNDYIHYEYPSPGFDQELDMTSRSRILLPEFAWWSQCHFPLSFKIMSTTVGIDDFIQLPFNIFPNPTATSTSIQFEKDPNDYTIEIFSLVGQLIQKYEPYENPTQIDFSTFQQGIYLILIRNKSTNKLYHEKIIKA